MLQLTYLDNNSWFIELGDKRILLDPWLVGSLIFSNLPWLFKGIRLKPQAIPANIDLILLSQGLEDHAHPETLAQLDRHIPVVTSPNGASVVQELGYTQVTALAPGESFTLAHRITIKAVPGAPIGPFLRENGYVLKDVIVGTSLYYEPHGYHDPQLKELAPIDVAIVPVVNLAIPLLGPIINGRESALQLVEWLQPKTLIPTAAGGDVQFEGLLINFLQSFGNGAELKMKLAQIESKTRLIEPKSGEPFNPLI